MTASRPDNEAIFHAARNIPEPDRRREYVREASGGDEARIAHVLALLAAADRTDSLLDRPLAGTPVATIDQPTTEGPGQVIGPYKLIEQIGEGGMGSVWKAQQTEPVKRLVAVKLIKAGMDSRQVIARFEAERQALALMDHPNIARVLDGGTTGGGRPYFVMDLVKGVPITRYCDEHHLTPRQRLELFIPVCQAVQHAHQKGIIHRDFKPSNVLVALYDGKPVPKIIDFGVAKAAGQQLTDKTLVTGFGAIVGTLEYMSPEQAETNQLDIDTRSDIYSLGVVLYELLTGSPPFSHKVLTQAGMLEMLRVIREQEPSKPSTKLSTAERLPTLAANRGTEPAKLTKLVRGELDWIVMKALEKDRNRRYETANGFAKDVERYLADEPVLACPPSAGYRLRKFARRNKGGLAVAALVLFFLVLLGSGVGWVLRDRSAREAEAVRQQGERQAKLAGQVEAVFAEVDRLEKEQKWPEALEAARRSEAAVAGGEADPATAERVHQRLKDLGFIDRLEQIRMERATLVEGKFNNAGTDQGYARAFRDYGVDVDELPVETSIDRLKARPALAVTLTAALDDWIFARRKVSAADVARWKRLVAVADGIDPEPLRNRVRAAWGQPVASARDDLRRLADSIDVRVQHPATLSILARGLQSVQDTGPAVRILRDAQYVHPGDFWLNFELGSVLDQQKDYEGAIRFYTAAVAGHPDSAAAHNHLGLALSGRKKFDEAIASYRKAIELDPNCAAAHNNLGVGLSGRKKFDEAIASYRKAIELDLEFANAYSNLSNALREQEKLEEAIAACRKAIELDPKFAHAYNGLGNVLRDQKKLDEAIAAYRKAIELDPKFAMAYSNLSVLLRKKGHVDEAIVACQRAIELDPKFATAHNRLGNALVAKKKLDEAIACYRKAIELDPKDPGAYYNLGLAKLQQKKPDEAIAAWRKATELDPKNVDAHKNLGNALRSQGKLEEAIASLNRAIELDRKSAHAHNGLGNVLRDQKKLDEAITAYRKAIELDPKFAMAYSNLSVLLRKKGHVDEAIVACQRAIELDPKFATAHYELGIALKAKGDLDGAIVSFEEVIRRRPGFTEAHFGLASALAGAKQWDRSASVYAAALKRFGAQQWPGPWYEAIRSDEVFTRLTAQQGDDRLPRIMRARLHVFERDWKRAAADYARAYESLANMGPANILPEGGDDLFCYGCLLLLLGDRPGYEQFCKKWADRVGDSPAWGYDLARAWGVSPRPVVTARQIVERAGKTVQANRAPWGLHVLSLAHYRNGEFKLAIERALESNGGNWARSAKALNWLVLALSHSRLGEAADARHSLQQALELAGRASPEKLLGVEWPDMGPQDLLECELLRREAEELINLKSIDRMSGHRP
jgi:eukaryotic-like serine/threonine-protein kinase